jgi:iron(III) transport system ATP-binding protein
MSEALLRLREVAVAYGRQRIVQDLSFCLQRQQVGCLLGPSGCGKTTLLRAIAGFEPVAAGQIEIEGQLMSTAQRLVPAEARNIGIVFQDYALFPHLTVAQNVAFGLRRRSAAERAARTDEVLERVGLPGMRDRFPHQLSGGQQQRVALARAIAPNPRLLLIDEPFSNLDATLKERLAQDLGRILRASGMTTILVTHDQQEAFIMADVIGVMQQGRLQQWADAGTLYHRPANRFVASFIGKGAVLGACVTEDGFLNTELGRIRLPRESRLDRDRRVDILVRPNQVCIDPRGAANATVIAKLFRGMDILYTLQLGTGQQILSVTTNDIHYAVGTALHASLNIQQPVVLGRTSA